MFRSLVVLGLLAVGTGAAQAECSVAAQKRWENVMYEWKQLERVPWRERYNPNNIAIQCRMRDVVAEISAAAKEYFPVCEPIVAGRAHVLVVHAEEALAAFDDSKCSKPKAASAKRK